MFEKQKGVYLSCKGRKLWSNILKNWQLLYLVKYLTNRSGCAKKSAYISKRDLLSRINVGRTTWKTYTFDPWRSNSTTDKQIAELKKKQKQKLIPIIVTPTKYCPGMLLIPTSQTALMQKCPLTCPADEKKTTGFECSNVASQCNLLLAPWFSMTTTQ